LQLGEVWDLGRNQSTDDEDKKNLVINVPQKTKLRLVALPALGFQISIR